MTTSRNLHAEPADDPVLLYQGEGPHHPWVPDAARTGTADGGSGDSGDVVSATAGESGAETASHTPMDADAAEEVAEGRVAEECASADGDARLDPHDVDLPVWLRITLIVLGIVLIAVGVAGLVLPGLQGILTILLGIALLSLVSHQAHRFLHWCLGPWPTMRDRVDGYRQRCYEWLNDKIGHAGASAVGAEEASAAEAAPIPGPAPRLNLETRRVGDPAAVAARDQAPLDETLDLVCGACTDDEDHASVATGFATDLPRAS